VFSGNVISSETTEFIPQVPSTQYTEPLTKMFTPEKIYLDLVKTKQKYHRRW
jgi:hypothetical protein